MFKPGPVNIEQRTLDWASLRFGRYKVAVVLGALCGFAALRLCGEVLVVDENSIRSEPRRVE